MPLVVILKQEAVVLSIDDSILDDVILTVVVGDRRLVPRWKRLARSILVLAQLNLTISEHEIISEHAEFWRALSLLIRHAVWEKAWLELSPQTLLDQLFPQTGPKH